jgi:hypothetical protein
VSARPILQYLGAVRRLAVVLATALACAHSPAPPPGPRPLTGQIQLQRGEASVNLDLRYELKPGRELEISANLRGVGPGSVGPVQVELRPTGLVLDGEATWTGEAASGQTASHTWRLRPEADGVARVEVRQGVAGQALDTATTAGFRVSADAIRLCGTADCAGEAP